MAVCPNCFSDIPDDVKQCIACNARFDRDGGWKPLPDEQKPHATEERTSQGRSPLLRLLLVIPLALVGAFIFLFGLMSGWPVLCGVSIAYFGLAYGIFSITRPLLHMLLVIVSFVALIYPFTINIIR